MSFPRYPRYKDSGVEWLGEVPEHWEVKRLRYLSIVRKGRLPSGTSPMPSADTDMPYLSMEYLRGETDTPSFVPVSQNLLRAESGDLLLLWDGSNAGEFLRAKQGVVSSTVALIEPRNVDREFLFFACKARERQLKDQTVGMGIPHVSGDELRDFLIPCPPLPEQTAIAEFLDRETGKIDELVAEQRRLMKLLKEKRQAVISHAVTRGLNPAAPLKPSGVEWLNDIPAHWRVVSFKHLARAGAKTFTDGDWIETPYITSDGVRLLQTGNVGIGYFKEQGFRYVSEETFNEFQCNEVKPRDVLICRLDGPVGRACLAPDLGVRMITSVDNAILKVADDVLPEFVVSLLSSVPWISWIDALCRVGGGFRLRISRSQLGEIRVPLPPLEEQLAIRERLGSLGKEFDTLTAEAQRAIDLLQERRTALISAAVTGQIDVRPLAEKKAA